MDNVDTDKKIKRIIWKFGKQNPRRNDSSTSDISSEDNLENSRKRNRCDSPKLQPFPVKYNSEGPCMMPLVPIPDVEEFSSKMSVISTGTACKGGVGPPVGVLDVGANNSAYYFRIALPGVRKDPDVFSCDVEHDGKVHVRGVTSTGGSTISRYSRVFEMKFLQRCVPGPFTLTFSLPGPVDPRLFSPNFRTDGVFEAVVLKYD